MSIRLGFQNKPRGYEIIEQYEMKSKKTEGTRQKQRGSEEYEKSHQMTFCENCRANCLE